MTEKEQDKLTALYNDLHNAEAEVRKARRKLREYRAKVDPTICPRCGGHETLEYVGHLTMYCEVDVTDTGYTSCGDVLEEGDWEEHHISCSQCDTYWDSSDEFEEEWKAKFLKEEGEE